MMFLLEEVVKMPGAVFHDLQGVAEVDFYHFTTCKKGDLLIFIGFAGRVSNFFTSRRPVWGRKWGICGVSRPLLFFSCVFCHNPV